VRKRKKKEKKGGRGAGKKKKKTRIRCRTYLQRFPFRFRYTEDRKDEIANRDQSIDPKDILMAYGDHQWVKSPGGDKRAYRREHTGEESSNALQISREELAQHRTAHRYDPEADQYE
jgi:hypothetical protein